MMTVRGAGVAILAAAVALLAGGRLWAADNFEATLDVERQEMFLGESFNAQVVFTYGDSDQVVATSMPDLSDFDVISRSEGSSQQINVTMGSFQRRTSQTVSLVLRPRKAGTLKLGPAVIRLKNGSQVKSQSYRIKVRDAGGSQAGSGGPGQVPGAVPGQDAAGDASAVGQADGQMGRPLNDYEKTSARLFVRPVVSAASCFLGQQVVVSFYLYTAQRISDVNITRRPGYLDTWTETVDLGRHAPSQQVAVAGQVYTAYLLEQVVVFPKRAGQLVIDSFQVDVLVGGGFFEQGRKFQRSTQPFALEVKPLPTEGQPPDFKPTNVGNYSFSARLDKAATAVNEPVTVTMNVSGMGNIKAVKLPTLESGDLFKVYPPTTDEESHIVAQGVQGSKTVEYLVVPLQAGTHDLPALSFAFFDPQEGVYKQVDAPRFSLSVAPGKNGDTGQAPGAPAAKIDTERLRPMHYNVQRLNRRLPVMSRPSFPYLQFGPLALVLLVYGGAGVFLLAVHLRSRTRESGRRQVQGALKQASAALAGGDYTRALAESSRAVEDAVFFICGKNIRTMNEETALSVLGQIVGNEDQARALVSLLAELDAVRFSPRAGSREYMEELVGRTRNLVSVLLG